MKNRDTQRQIAERFASFLTPEERERHPLYAALCQLATPTSPLVAALLDASPAQRRPNLLFAALHDLSLSEPSSPLRQAYPTAAWFHSLRGDLDAPAAEPSIDPGADLATSIDIVFEVLGAQHHQVAELVATRSTQTNEVGRSSPLLAGLSLASRGEAISLIDLGCSAGLNLAADHYDISWSDGSHLGDTASDVHIDTELRAVAPDVSTPEIVWRAGVDLSPIDLADDAEARWLLACQWPDDLPRFERTRRAIGAWRRSAPDHQILRGDLVSSLPDLVDAAPSDTRLVVHHSWVAAYLELDEQRSLAALLRRLAHSRPLSWLYLEHPSEVPGLDPPRCIGTRLRGSSLLVLEEDGTAVVLAQGQPHGTWLSFEPGV